MEMEIYELSEDMTKKELRDRYKLLKLYENEKKQRVEEQTYGSHHGGMMYGQDFVTYWNDEDIIE